MDNISKVKARKLIEPKYKVLQNYTDNQKKTLNGSRENYLSFMKKSPGRESQGNNEEFKA